MQNAWLFDDKAIQTNEKIFFEFKKKLYSHNLNTYFKLYSEIFQKR